MSSHNISIADLFLLELLKKLMQKSTWSSLLSAHVLILNLLKLALNNTVSWSSKRTMDSIVCISRAFCKFESHTKISIASTDTTRLHSNAIQSPTHQIRNESRCPFSYTDFYESSDLPATSLSILLRKTTLSTCNWDFGSTTDLTEIEHLSVTTTTFLQDRTELINCNLDNRAINKDDADTFSVLYIEVYNQIRNSISWSS